MGHGEIKEWLKYLNKDALKGTCENFLHAAQAHMEKNHENFFEKANGLPCMQKFCKKRF